MAPERVLRVFASKGFVRFARKSGLTDAYLCSAARDIQAGRIDADLGGGLYKQRVARKNEGKSGGFRTIVMFHSGTYCIFVYGFAKKDKADITQRELAELKVVAKEILAYTDETYNEATRKGAFQQISCGEGLS